MSPVYGGGRAGKLGAAVLYCPALAELVIVGLQQGLGNVPWLTAGQLLTGALLWLAAAAAAATSVTATAAAAWQVSIVLRGKKEARDSELRTWRSSPTCSSQPGGHSILLTCSFLSCWACS